MKRNSVKLFYASADIDESLKNRNCGVWITIHRQSLFRAVTVVLCVIHHGAKDVSSPPLHHTHQANDLAQNLYGLRDDGFHGIVLRLEAVMSVLLIKTFDSG